jgi:molybdopterin biosynthesis enzyme
VDHRALEAEILHAAFQFIRRRFRVRRGKRGKSGKPVWVGKDRGMQIIIRLPGNAGACLGIEALGRRRTMAEHLNVDTGGVHFFQSQFTDIVKPVEQRAAAGGIAPDKRIGHDLVPVMLFKSDDLDSG